LNWKVALTLLLIFTTTAVATLSIGLSLPTLSQIGTPKAKTIDTNEVLSGDPVGGSGGPH